jgi:2'-5' RNA ligase
VVEALDAWGAQALDGDPALRRVPAASLHVTLCYLGRRPADEVEAIGAAALGRAAPVPALRVAGAAWLGRRVLAVDLDDGAGACGRLHAAVSEALVELGVYTPEARPFRPHVTVARVRRGGRPRRRVAPPPALDPFSAPALTLFRSEPGARYEPLARERLGRR